jgi:hypothetical protein
MNKLEKIINKLQNLKFQYIFESILNRDEIQSFIINTIQSRLYNKGKDSNNKELKTDIAIKRDYIRGFKYSYNTIIGTKFFKGKKYKGQPFDRVTLNDTGQFYSSFKIIPTKNQFIIRANFNKKNSDISDNFKQSYQKTEFYKVILSLTNDEKFFFIDKIIKPSINNYITKILSNI